MNKCLFGSSVSSFFSHPLTKFNQLNLGVSHIIKDQWTWNQRIRLWIFQFLSTWAWSLKLYENYQDFIQHCISIMELSHCRNMGGIQLSTFYHFQGNDFFSSHFKASEIGMHLVGCQFIWQRFFFLRCM